MIRFNDIKYERLDYLSTKKEIDKLIKSLMNASDIKEYIDIVRIIINIQNKIEEMYDYVDIRNMRDSNDEFYKKEMDYWNEVKIEFDVLFLPFYKECLNSKYRLELEKYIPINFFNTIYYQLKINSDSIVDLQKYEEQLKQKYRNLTRNNIDFLDEKRSISYVLGFCSDINRDIRKKAHDAINDYYYKNQSEFDNIFNELIKTRNSIAKSCGFNNYSEYSIYKLRRFGYDYNDIKIFRNNIIKYIVPICNELLKLKKKELNIEDLKYYDTIFFKIMPKPLYKGKDLLDNLGTSFKKIDSELYSLYKDMLDYGYIDLENREGKINFTITNYLTSMSYPTITGNFKNTFYDIISTTHEMGHAFQKYNASLEDKKYIVSSLLKYPTFDIAEMFSNSMELIALKGLKNIFDNIDYKKYCFMVLYSIIVDLPYICLVDEFQETIYKETKEPRKVWLDLVKKYGLVTNNSGHINLDTGGFFYRQSHIFFNPFYYIDYAISYFGALSIWDKSLSNLDTFKNIAKVASYYPLKDLIDKYKLYNPFDQSDVEKISKKLKNILEDYKLNK